MVRRNSNQVLWGVSRLFDQGTMAGAGEDQLLQRFVSAHDELAFETLVRRHGPMVWSVCRRVLRDPHDAEDAFQATFLVLARKADSIRERQFLGTWLYGVAYRVAARSRQDIETRRRRECHGRDDVPSVVAVDDLERREFRSLLDDEIGRLPERYRTPIVLHYFQGWTHLQIAEQLACPVGTVHSRLTRAKDRLRGRLVLRGLEPDAALASSRAGEEPDTEQLPANLIGPTVLASSRFALGRPFEDVTSATVFALVESTLRSLFMGKLKAVASIVLAFAGLAVSGTAVLALHDGAKEKPKQNPPRASQGSADRLARDQIPPYELKVAGSGVPEDAPEGLVAVLGDSRLKHGSEVNAVAYSPDGTLMASAGGDGTLRLWDAASGEERLRLEARSASPESENRLTCLAFSHDGRTIAAGGSNAVVTIWEIATGRQRHTIQTSAPVMSLAFHPDGRRLATGQKRDATLWDVSTGKALFSFPQNIKSPPDEDGMDRVALAFLSRDRTIAVGYPDGTIGEWDLETGKRLKTFQAHMGGVRALATDADEIRLISGGGDGSVKLWNPASGTLLRSIPKAHEFTVLTLAVRGDGTVASGSLGREIKIWEIATGTLQRSWPVSPTSGPSSLSFSPDGRSLVSAGQGIRVWDAESGEPKLQFSGHIGRMNCLAFGPDGQTLATGGSDGRLTLWDLPNRRERWTDQTNVNVLGVAYSPDGESLASVDRFGEMQVKVLETKSGRVTKGWNLPGEHGQFVLFSPDARWLAARSFDRSGQMALRLWDMTSGKLHSRLTLSEGSFGFSRDGGQLFFTSKSTPNSDYLDSLTEWNIREQTTRANFAQFEGIVRLHVEALSARGKSIILTGPRFGPDGLARTVVVLWDTQKQRTRLVLDHGHDAINGLAIADDGRSLVTFDSRQGKVRVWDPRDGALRQTIRFPNPSSPQILGVAFAPDGHHIATALSNGTAYVLRIQVPREVVEEVTRDTVNPQVSPSLPSELGNTLVGKPAPELTQIRGWAHGEPARIADLRGSHVLIHFWNTFSPQQMPGLMRLHQQFGDRGLKILVVFPDSGRTVESVRATLDDLSRTMWGGRRVPFRVAIDGGGASEIPGISLKAQGATHAAYRIVGESRGRQLLPVNRLIGPDGRILDKTLPFNLETVPVGDFEKLFGVAAAPCPGLEAFQAHYALAEGKVLRRVAPPFPQERSDYLFQFDPDGLRAEPSSHLFAYGASPRLVSSSGAEQRDLRSLLQDVIRLSPYEFEIPQALGDFKISGDWVRREGESPAEMLEALKVILRDEAGIRVDFTNRMVIRKVIVVRGRFQFRPLPDAGQDPFVHLYVETPPPAPRRGGPNMNTLGEMLNWLGYYSGRAFINESEEKGERKLEWQSHLSPYFQDLNGDKDPALLDKILENLTGQSSLQFRRETRKVRVWSVTQEP